MASNRPQFWLQVRKDYIFDNFDNLLNYLRQYNYVINEDHPDYDSTLECMTSLCDEIADRVLSTPFFELPELDYDMVAVVRLFCATILASNKSGVTPYRVIGALVDCIMKHNIAVSDSQLRLFYEILADCVRGKEMIKCGFTWDDITSDVIRWGLFIEKFSRMTFVSCEDDRAAVYIENRGLFVVPASGLSDIAVVNRVNYGKMHPEEQFLLPGLLRVVVSKKDHENASDFERLYQVSSRLLAAQDQMTPAARRVYNVYSDNEEFIVKVVSKRGIRVEAETIDPDYSHIRGKVLLQTPDKRPGAAAFSETINEGDYLKVSLSEDPEYAFEIYYSFENFYRQYAASQAGMKIPARFADTYANGTEWVTQDGIRVGIDKGKFLRLSPEEKETCRALMADHGICEVRLYARPPKMEGEQFFVYAEYSDLYLEDEEEEISFTIYEADRELVGYFLEESAEEGRRIEEKGKCIRFEEAERELCVPMLSVLSRVVESGQPSSCSRLEHITATEMLCKILGREKELAYMDHERRYLYSQVMFARNKECGVLTHSPLLDGVPEVVSRERVIAALRSYRKKDTRVTSPERAAKEKDVSSDVSALVSASNNLVDIIESVELNNIKQAIARAMSVEDEYVTILESRTHYGMESIGLEFKTSVVFPPANRRRLASLVADPETQKWAIVKAVCGFLNSRSGGELLLGVDDKGYANGVEDDMRVLTEMKYITSPTLDHYRTYLQYILDYVFRESNPKVSSSDIARLCVRYVPEENAEGKKIMRIQVRPYGNGIVTIVPERPQWMEEAYVRHSGRTVPLTSAMAPEIMGYKGAIREDAI